MKSILKSIIFLALSGKALSGMSGNFDSQLFFPREEFSGYPLTIPLPRLLTQEEIAQRQIASREKRQRKTDQESQEKANQAKKQRISKILSLFKPLLPSLEDEYVGSEESARETAEIFIEQEELLDQAQATARIQKQAIKVFFYKEILMPLIEELKGDTGSAENWLRIIVNQYLVPILPYTSEVESTNAALIIDEFLNHALQLNQNRQQKQVVFDTANPIIIKFLKITKCNDQNKKNLLAQLMRIYRDTRSLRLTQLPQSQQISKEDLEEYLPFDNIDHEQILEHSSLWNRLPIPSFVLSYFPKLHELVIDGILTIDSIKALQQLAESSFAEKIEKLKFFHTCESIPEEPFECVCGYSHEERNDIIVGLLSKFTNLKKLIIEGSGEIGILNDEFFHKLANSKLAGNLETLIAVTGELTNVQTVDFNKFKKLRALNLWDNSISDKTFKNLAESDIAQNIDTLNLGGDSNSIQTQFTAQNLNRFVKLKKLYMHTLDPIESGWVNPYSRNYPTLGDICFNVLASSNVAPNLEVLYIGQWTISQRSFTVDNLNKFIKLREFTIPGNEEIGNQGFLAFLSSNLLKTLDLDKFVFKTDDEDASFPRDAREILKNQCSALLHR